MYWSTKICEIGFFWRKNIAQAKNIFKKLASKRFYVSSFFLKKVSTCFYCSGLHLSFYWRYRIFKTHKQKLTGSFHLWRPSAIVIEKCYQADYVKFISIQQFDVCRTIAILWLLNIIPLEF